VRGALPRKLADGLYWLSECGVLPPIGTMRLHGYASVFLLCGERRSMIIEGGDPERLDLIDFQLDRLIGEQGLPPVEFVFATHAEPPHSSGVGLWLEKYPNAALCGDVRDYHLYFPSFEDRFRQSVVGETIDLGGTEFVFVEPVIRDLDATLWGYDTRRRALFPGDGFAYSHYHDAGQCGLVAEEVPELGLEEMAATFAQRALYWMVFTDMEPYIERLHEMIFTELEAELIAPTHGMPITDPARTCPRIYDGLRMSSKVNTTATVT
jgi:flavorubredoxin